MDTLLEDLTDLTSLDEVCSEDSKSFLVLLVLFAKLQT